MIGIIGALSLFTLGFISGYSIRYLYEEITVSSEDAENV